jgi:hypothetical protein
MVGGWASWLQHERAARRQVVESALERAAELREQMRWIEAAAALEQARQVMGDSKSADLRRRLVAAEAELDAAIMARAVEQSREHRSLR